MEDHLLHEHEVQEMFEKLQEAARGARVNVTAYAVGLLLACCVIDARASGTPLDVEDVVAELQEVIEYGIVELKDRETH